ncbi:hypothetical protein DFJ73DRAFT_761290 [Zopfochytrium polystomum]|nr:hypothetical protein DFJ73DRAFT_761290 [Zopfochytrium polystomum]
MGCSASKSLQQQVVITTTQGKSFAAATSIVEKVENDQTIGTIVADTRIKPTNGIEATPPVALATDLSDATADCGLEDTDICHVVPSLKKEVVPSIQGKKVEGPITKAVAFEIPLDEDPKMIRQDDSAASLSASRPSLPKLSIDVAAKLANTEARWKDIEQAREVKRAAHRRTKPSLSSSQNHPTHPPDENPIALKQRLLEKEAHAAQNRLREIEKLQSKLARQEERARRVLARKRMLERSSGGGSSGANAAAGALAAASGGGGAAGTTGGFVAGGWWGSAASSQEHLRMSWGGGEEVDAGLGVGGGLFGAAVAAAAAAAAGGNGPFDPTAGLGPATVGTAPAVKASAAAAAAAAAAKAEFSLKMAMHAAKILEDADSGKGSSRSGSGRSVGIVDVGDVVSQDTGNVVEIV